MIYFTGQARPNIKDHQKETDDVFMSFFIPFLPANVWVWDNNLEMPAVERPEPADLR